MDLVPLGPGFAAELGGIDLIDVVSSDCAYRAVREAFEAHTVIVFRDQKVSDELQIGFSRAFGPLERTKRTNSGTRTALLRRRQRWPPSSQRGSSPMKVLAASQLRGNRRSREPYAAMAA